MNTRNGQMSLSTLANNPQLAAQLSAAAQQSTTRNIIDLFADPQRTTAMSVNAAGIFLDYSKQNITSTELELLLQLADQHQLTQKIAAMFSGEQINNTEQRAVLHTLLRAPIAEQTAVLGDLAVEVEQTNQRMTAIVDDVHSGRLVGITGKRFTDVLAIGIGGSFYGIKVGLSALYAYCRPDLKVHVLANVDGEAVAEKLALLQAETTLVVVISKTFTTQETLLNANAVKRWMLSQFSQQIIQQQWFAVSSNVSAAATFGIAAEQVLPMWDWVGGRFSIWSAVALPLALAIGNSHFAAFKQGAYHMDCHFKTAPWSANMPVLLALLGIWNRNYLHYPSLAILPYAHTLRALPGYLQQTDMESNGKSVSNTGQKLPWLTAPVVFGQEGTNGQHAFMQLMHQSDDIIPTDFIVAMAGHADYADHHQVLVANCFAQAEALMTGKTLVQVRETLQQQGYAEPLLSDLAAHKTMKGNTPSNMLVLEHISPACLGALLALYEHKIFVQGTIWQVNSFDQWGVELGKQLGQSVLASMNKQHEQSQPLSASTQQLIKRYNLQ